MSGAAAMGPAHAAALFSPSAKFAPQSHAPQSYEQPAFNNPEDSKPVTGQPAVLPDTQIHSNQNGYQNGTSGRVDLDIICGPLINYRHLSEESSSSPRWHGSVLIVTPPTQSQPDLILKCVGPVKQQDREQSPEQDRRFPGEKLLQDPNKAFFRFLIDLPVQDFEANWQYAFTQSSNAPPKVFAVPSKQQSMRILFHSCNGFSVGTDEDAWSGPALWNDVIRNHNEKPFHVMIGGGDQIYNDNVRVGDGPLKEWTDIGNPSKRGHYPFNEELRARCDKHYYDNYIRWYAMEPFKSANSIIPQLNIWDDHDIIDGFGSYTDHFMKCHVFRGIGGVAYK